MSLGNPVSCLKKSNKVTSNYFLCAFSISFIILYTSHLLHLKLGSSALFNFPLSVSHTLPLSSSVPFCNFSALSMCGLVASTVCSVPARYVGTTDYRAAQLCSLFSTLIFLFIPTILFACLTTASTELYFQRSSFTITSMLYFALFHALCQRCQATSQSLN